MTAVWKVRGLTLLLWVGTLWRCGDGLFFEAPPLASNALLAMVHPLLENVLQTIKHFKISCLRAPFSWLEKPRNCIGARSGLNGGCSNAVPLIHFIQAEQRIQFRSQPTQFLGFSNHEKGALRQEISKWLTVCSTFSRNGWNVVRSASFVKGGALKSDHHHTSTKFQSNNVNPQILQMALVYASMRTQSIYLQGH
jgi:hypothetical protein